MACEDVVCPYMLCASGISGRNNVAHQVDLLHRELGSSLSTDAQSQGHHNTDANGGGVMVSFPISAFKCVDEHISCLAFVIFSTAHYTE